MRDGIKTTSGRLFTIVGPSGCGKDSILNALQPRLPSLKVAKRVITRPKNGGDEDHFYLCQRLFDRAAQDGSFYSNGMRMDYLMVFPLAFWMI